MRVPSILFVIQGAVPFHIQVGWLWCLDNAYYLAYFMNNILFSLFCVIQGAELAAHEGKSAAALAACRTLAEELTELRFPAPRILAFKVSSSRFLKKSVNFAMEFPYSL